MACQPVLHRPGHEHGKAAESYGKPGGLVSVGAQLPHRRSKTPHLNRIGVTKSLARRGGSTPARWGRGRDSHRHDSCATRTATPTQRRVGCVLTQLFPGHGPPRGRSRTISRQSSTQMRRLMQTMMALPSTASRRCSNWSTMSCAPGFKHFWVPTTLRLGRSRVRLLWCA